MSSRGPGPSTASQPAYVIDALRSSELLKNFTPTGVQILAGIAQEKTFPRGTPLFVENMIGDGLFVVVSGAILVSVRGPDGRDCLLDTLGPGDSLGEAALLRSGPRLCSATAERDSIALEISRRDVAVLQRSKPQACLKLMMGIVELLGNRMREADTELRHFVAWRAGRGS